MNADGPGAAAAAAALVTVIGAGITSVAVGTSPDGANVPLNAEGGAGADGMASPFKIPSSSALQNELGAVAAAAAMEQWWVVSI